MGIEVDPALLFAGGCLLSYWNMNTSFGAKCNYLSTMYNDIIKEHAEVRDDAAEILSCN